MKAPTPGMTGKKHSEEAKAKMRAAQLARKRTPVEERFWSKVDVRGPDECWPWTAGRYGKSGGFRVTSAQRGGKMEYAPRVAYWLATGEHPGELCVCHTCDDPLCVNPAHLWLGTHQDNANDRELKGRTYRPKGPSDTPQARYRARQLAKKGSPAADVYRSVLEEVVSL